jgi:ketosteroid isomerase-like protein
MSQQNVEIVRAGYQWFNRTHEVDVDALHPDFEWHTRDDLPDSATQRGSRMWPNSFPGDVCADKPNAC